MSDWKTMKNNLVNECLDQPLLTSLFIADFAILLFHRPPFLYSLIMMSALIAMAMYFGQKLALFDLSTAFKFLKTFNFPKSSATPTAAAAEAKPVVASVTEPKSAKPAAKPKAKAKT